MATKWRRACQLWAGNARQPFWLWEDILLPAAHYRPIRVLDGLFPSLGHLASCTSQEERTTRAREGLAPQTCVKRTCVLQIDHCGRHKDALPDSPSGKKHFPTPWRMVLPTVPAISFLMVTSAF